MRHDSSSMRTAASRVRFLGAARSGTAETWHMRATSVALLPLSIAFVWIVLSLLGKNYQDVVATLGSPLPALLILLFVLASVYHMKIGMQSIIDDYVHEPHFKDWALLGNLFFSFCIGLACIYAVLKLSFL
ncbi:succinate dehydrogenase, hydrophobic membrane anchor protein [Beijerinckia indica]|uniref:Succinate dehydrogenase hydrophobic membrane anchor subunit n=1 Tax=Beijerinckia indica subsp. indica (strain ATCC 9039 / DSM 1715 / NCIMB 8712) TaxID=395963 RepID=B2IJU7_BEII9|nr:succinate dehydrogenase, hydrophobic membrane anchor protein [Beijerinckia indica]ACB96322.1 succinate dehydrogenase, hydrophobic membrane anchor protein [Beijerinckia indica subsp. indica ATCC 9039]